MRTLKSGIILLALTLALGLRPAGAMGAEVRVSAAASLSEAVGELVAVYGAQHPDTVVLPNFGGSGALAQQIAQGAPADLYISANRQWLEYLVGEGRISSRTVRGLAGNTLVFVGAPNSGVTGLAGLPGLARIAIGSPRSVPAGQYAEQALRGAGIYEELQQQNKLVLAKDVRQALLYADRGEVDGAFVYRTDALLARQVAILFTVPEKLHAPIDYPLGLTVTGEKNPAARAFYEFLLGPQALAVLGKFGFSAPRS